MIVDCLYFERLGQLFGLASGVVIVVCLYVAGLEATMPVESGDVICLHFAGLEQLFDIAGGVECLFLLVFVTGLEQLFDLVSGVR